MSTTNAGTELNVPESSAPLTRRQIREREMAQQAPVAVEEPAVTPEPVVAEVTAPAPVATVAEVPPAPAPKPVDEPVSLIKPVVAAPAPASAVEKVAVEEPDEAIVVLNEPYAPPVAKVKDSSLPSLFGDDPEEDEVEVPVAAAEYAREAPAAKYLDDEQPRRIVLPYAPEPTFAHSAPRQYSSRPVAHAGEWTGKTKLQIVALSVLFYGLAITQTAIYFMDLIAQAYASGATSM